MKESQFELEAKKGSLIRLQAKQIEQENKISLQKEAKNRLVKINEDQIKLYKELYEEEKRQQETLAEEIKAINNVLKIAKLKYYEEGEQFVVAELEEMLNGYERRAQNIDFSVLENLSIHSLKWPSDTALGMSAYFRYAADGYEKIFGVRHNAIDIPLYQGSQIRAAADGIVHTVKDNGYGYSYISVVHAGGFMTNYGHLSKMLVEVGDVVKSGDIIALSGGMPGTPGAGYMTTGPHLHFEVLRNGVYVDPLNYLPLNVLTEEQAEELPEKYQDDWKADVLRSQRIKRHLENEQESAN
jgi:murein DD-endopeptidase MepM/ murein hydrolase activator NlpD